MAVIDVLWRQRWAVAIVLIVGIVVTISTILAQKTTFVATATVLYTGHDSGGNLSLGQLDMATLATSDVVTTRTMRALHIDMSPSEFAASIVTKPAYQSNIMPISFTSPDPKVAVDAANGIAESLRGYFLEITRSRFDGISAYLDKAMRKRQAQVVELDRRLDVQASGDPTLAEDGAATILNQQLATLTWERDHNDALLTGAQALAATDGPHLDRIEPLVKQQIAGTDYVYRQLQVQWALDAAQLAAKHAEYTSSYPGLKGLTKKVQGEGDSVDERLSELSAKPSEDSYAYVGALSNADYHNALVQGSQAQVAAYDREIARVRAELARVPTDGARLAALRRERDTAREAYQTLAERRELLLAEQAQAATTGTVEIIDRARVASVSKKRGVLLNVGAALGFILLAVTIAFLLDSADQRMRSIDSIAELYGKPVVGTLKAP
jgi:uncharacterized protein involved in exopolysaccharide biosynthesis